MTYEQSLKEVQTRVGLVRDASPLPYNWPVMWNEAVRQLINLTDDATYLRHGIAGVI